MKKHAKKALGHEVSVLGKTVPTLAIAALFLVGGGTAAVLTSFGTITGQATVQQAAITLDGESNPSLNWAWNDAGNVVGETFVEKHKVSNNDNQVHSVSFTTECAIEDDDGDSSSYSSDSNEVVDENDDAETGQTSGNIVWADIGGSSNQECNGINQTFVEYYDDAGADLSEYTAPSSCTYSVSKASDLNELVDGDSTGVDVDDDSDNEQAGSGDTVCVSSDLDSPVTISQDGVTVASAKDSLVTVDGTSDGSGEAIRIEASNVKVTGFKVTNDYFGVRADGNAHTTGDDTWQNDTVISYVNATGVGYQGVVFDYVKNGTIKDVSVSDTSDDGITLWYARNTAIKDSTVTDSGSDETQGQESDPGVFVDGHNVDITGLKAVGNLEYGVLARDKEDSENDYTDFSDKSNTVTLSNSVFKDNSKGDMATMENEGATLQATANWFGTDGIQTSGSVTADWETKSAGGFSVNAGETDNFGVVTEFATNLYPHTYESTSTLNLAS